MKLGSLRSTANRDGEFVIVSQDNTRAVRATSIAPSLREAVENWAACKPRLEALYRDLNAGKAEGSFAVDETRFH